MILLVVPRGFSTGTELLKTSAHSSHTDFPMVNFDPPDSDRETHHDWLLFIFTLGHGHGRVGSSPGGSNKGHILFGKQQLFVEQQDNRFELQHPNGTCVTMTTEVTDHKVFLVYFVNLELNFQCI